MRLTTDLINQSLSYISPLRERELDLRGNKIPAIENLGAARDQECIDFTDNDIATLGNFPLSPKLRTLLLARNRITTIQPSIAKSIPGLTTLVLAQNRITELSALSPLAGLKRLTHLSLVDNPVTTRENYRLFAIALLPALRYLDYTRVRKAERDMATSRFGSADAPTAAFRAISGAGADGPPVLGALANGGAAPTSALRLSEAEKRRIKEKLMQAKSLNEIARLEKALEEGRIPVGLLDGGADEMEE